MCIGQRVLPITEKSKCFVRVLQVLMVFQLGVTVIAFVAHDVFLKQGIISLFFLLILFIGWYKLSYQAMMIYIFMSLFFFVTFLVFLLTIVQNEVGIVQQKETETSTNTVLNFSIAIASCSFYLFTAIFAFFPYRQFKAIEYAQNPALAEYMEQNVRLSQLKNNKEQKYGSDQKLGIQMKQSNSHYFKGKGVRIG